MITDDLITTFRTAQAAFTERVHAVAGDQWELGTPDEQWTAADLLWHLVDEHRWTRPLLAGLDLDTAGAVAAGLGPDSRDGTTLVREWDRAAAQSAAAFGADGALTGSVAISRGRVPASEYLEEMILDLVVHAWDLGTAIGYQQPLPASAVADIYPLAQVIVDRTPRGMFGPPAEAGAGAPLIDRLVALTGRRPR
jgi:uncharacterized protein (TIGR03086 family)